MGFRRVFLLLALLAVAAATVGVDRLDHVSPGAVVRPVVAGNPSGIARGLADIRYADAAHLAQPKAAPVAVSAAQAPKPPSPTSCAPKSIDVDLTTQQLVAYDCGRTYLATPITSGRPGLPTPTGTFAIFLKEQNVYFYSPWLQGDPNYYPPMFVAYAMEFLQGEYYLHTDPDEPANAFGAGSENGPYASHGCVHVPTDVMARLYAWAAEGTAVTIHY